MENVYLISEKTLKENSIINDNVDPAYLDPAMDLAQNVGLHQVIGTSLLNKLTDLVGNDEIKNKENAQYKYLIDNYITNYLMYKVVSEVTVILGYKYRNAGIVNTGDEHAKDTSMSDAQYMKAYWDDKANFFATRITDYLTANSAKFPEYRSSNQEDIKGSDIGFNTGIYLG